MEYTQKTVELLDRLDKVATAEYRFNRSKIIKCLKRFYALYGMEFPKKIIKLNDPFDERLLGIYEKQARQAWQAWQAGQAGQAWQAEYYSIDYWECWLVFSYEFSQTNKTNEHDEKFIKGQFILLEAKEAGLGTFVDDENGTLYLIPCSVARLDERNRFHSETYPAIAWKGGFEVYYLHGVYLEKEMWEKIVNKTMIAKEAVQLINQEHRTLAMQYLGGNKLLKELGGEKFSEDEYGELWRLNGLKDLNNNSYIYFIDTDPSKGEKIYLRTRPEVKTPQEAMTLAYRLQMFQIKYNPSLRT